MRSVLLFKAPNRNVAELADVLVSEAFGGLDDAICKDHILHQGGIILLLFLCHAFQDREAEEGAEVLDFEVIFWAEVQLFLDSFKIQSLSFIDFLVDAYYVQK